MRITDLLNKETILLNGNPANKMEAIDRLVSLMEKGGNIKDVEKYKSAVLKRESEGTTGIGEGVAIPHAKTKAVAKAGLAAMVVKGGVDFDSLDGSPVELAFMIAAPDTEENVHLEVLGRLSVLLMDEHFRQNLIQSVTVEEFLKTIDITEKEKFPEEVSENIPSPSQGHISILAVTACPTGIAHTYMAAESLENKASEMGVTIKVETNGSGGVKNALTKQEIEDADCIIVAADKNVEMARFNGKPVIMVKVADGISRAAELIEQAKNKNAPIFQSSEAAAHMGEQGEESAGRKLYKHLMNGVSHMLPFVIGGGILIALSFMFDGANAGTEIFGKGNELSAFLKTVGEVSFGMMFAVLAGFIAMSIGDRPALALGFVGGLLARDGGSGFFGALIAGFLGGYIIVWLRKLFDKLPRALEGTKPVLLYPFFGVLLMGAAMVFIVNPPVAAFNGWLTNSLNQMGSTSKILLGIVLGGMMSIDFGGPLNKAAYVFGTASIATGQLDIMAAVMAGGMVPPLAIALATTFFQKKFTKKECQTSITNYIMGLSFITEGAIPFAASDPIRVIPACAIGSAVAGGLAMLFGCGSRAPHGGIFVVGIMDNAPMFLVSLVVGAVVGMALLALFKKSIPEQQR